MEKRGSAHKDCNIKVKLSYEIPVVFHSLKNYDSHFIMQEQGKFNFKINVIPNGLGKNMWAVASVVYFIDSFQFLSYPSDSSVKNLGKDDCKYLSQEFDNDILYLVKQKEFYSCEYMSDCKKFKEELRSIEKFYSSLTNKKLSDKDYGHVLKVSNTFEMKKMKNHHELYLKCDVLLLAVFEKFRNSSLKNYGLCPSRFLSARALSWNAMLKMTKVELELISDVQMYLFPEKGMRGGLSYISKRYNETNKKYLKSLKSLNKNQKHYIFGNK